MSDPPSSTIFFALTGLGLLLTYAIGWIKRSTTRYMITDRRIQIRTGLISRNDSSTQLDRVQNVNVSQSVFQRLLGIGNIDWDTAGTDASDSDFTFYGIDDPGSLRQRVDQALNASH
jgi:putative membrane protein